MNFAYNKKQPLVKLNLKFIFVTKQGKSTHKTDSQTRPFPVVRHFESLLRHLTAAIVPLALGNKWQRKAALLFWKLVKDLREMADKNSREIF